MSLVLVALPHWGGVSVRFLLGWFPDHIHKYDYDILYYQVERTIRYTLDKVYLN